MRRRVFERTLIEKHIFRVIAVVFGIFMIRMGFMKWPDILVDFGRELYIPWQISQGKALYRDIAFFNGPLSVHVHAALFRVFGVHLSTIVVFNLLLTGGMVTVLYRFFCRICDEWTAFATTITFLGVFGFNQYMGIGNFNYVCPYSYELTHAICLSIPALYICTANLRCPRYLRTITLGFFLGGVFLLKAEVFFALVSTLPVCWIILFFKHGKRLFFMTLAALISGFIFAVGLMTAVLATSMTIMESIQSILFPYQAVLNQSVSSGFFYQLTMGLDDPWVNIIIMVLSAIVWTLIFVGLKLLAGRITTFRPAGRVSAISILFISILMAAWFMRYARFWQHSIKGVSIIGIVICLRLAYKLINSRGLKDDGERRSGLLLFGTFSILMTIKILLNINATSYGFALAMPITLFFIASGLTVFPSRQPPDPHLQRTFRTLIMVVVIVFVFLHVTIAREVFSMKRYSVSARQDTFWDINLYKASFTQSTLDYIDRTMPPNATFVVFPEGVMFNYLCRRSNPTPYVNFMPVELQLFGEQTIISSLNEHPPDYVIIVERKTLEYGVEYFGRDYGVSMGRWIENNYSDIWTIGDRPLTGKGFGIRIGARREASNN